MEGYTPRTAIEIEKEDEIMIKKASQVMTDEQNVASEEREVTFEAGYKKGEEEIKKQEAKKK